MIDFSTLNSVAKSVAGLDTAENLIDLSTNQIVNNTYTSGIQQIQAFQTKANGFANAISASNGIYGFNAAVDNNNTVRTINKISQEYHRVNGQQLAQQANTGVDINSKSAMLVREDALANYQSRINETLVDAENTRRAKLYTQQQEQSMLSQQLNAELTNANTASQSMQQNIQQAQFGAQVQKYKIRNKTQNIIPTLLSNINLENY